MSQRKPLQQKRRKMLLPRKLPLPHKRNKTKRRTKNMTKKKKPTRDSCKYMRTRYNWTPNDYDLSFPVDEIPANIPAEDTANLTHRLQKKFPLAKTIHLDLDEDPKSLKNNITMHTNIFLTVNENIVEVKPL